MKLIFQTILFVIAVTVALTMIFHHSTVEPDSGDFTPTSFKTETVSPRRVSRFLQEKVRNPNVGDHCNKDAEVCEYKLEGRNTTCCNNKCKDLMFDDKNCGACKKKCDSTYTCCNGECVNLSFDKRHCGICNSKCMPNGYCIYGICDYA